MRASKPRQAGTSRRERIAVARLSELAAEARAGRDATTPRAAHRQGHVYDNSHLTIAGASINRMIAMKLHAGRPPDLADLDILLKEARVETRREAVRLHELTYGTEPMAAEADLYLIERYGRRPDRDTGPTR